MASAPNGANVFNLQAPARAPEPQLPARTQAAAHSKRSSTLEGVSHLRMLDRFEPRHVFIRFRNSEIRQLTQGVNCIIVQGVELTVESPMKMDMRLNLVTLGVADVERSKTFYEKLGWTPSIASQGDVVFFQAGAVVLALYPRNLLAEDAKVSAVGSGFGGFTLAQNVESKERVSEVLKIAERAGARILKPAEDVFWGGHSGYFADPDGNCWEIAWNPLFPLNERGEVQLP